MPSPTRRTTAALTLYAALAWCGACAGGETTEAAPTPVPLPGVAFGDVGEPKGDARFGVRWTPSWKRGQTTGSVRVQRLASDGDAFGEAVLGAPEDAGLLSTRKGLRVLTTAQGEVFATDVSIQVDGTLTAKGASVRALGGPSTSRSSGGSTAWGSFLSPDATESASAPQVAPAAAGVADVPAPPVPAPYAEGWLSEVAFTDDGAPTVTTRRAMGRFAFGAVLVMPDQRTVYMSEHRDDGGGLYLFVADAPGDLSAGRLYAADVREDTDHGADLLWIPLGRATSREIEEGLAGGARTFAELFDVSLPVGGMCADPTVLPVAVSGTPTCLKPRAGLESLATRLETHRMAAARGATVEWTGASGLAYDQDQGRVYLALSTVGATMSDERGDLRRAPPNACGAVLAFSGLTSANDQIGALIPTTFAATHVETFIEGAPTGKPGADACEVSRPANPSALAAIPGHPQLLIGEATTRHALPALWAWDTSTRTGVRIATGPVCGAWAGLHWTPDLAGASWLTFTYHSAFACPPDVPLSVEVVGRLTLPAKDASRIDSRAFVGVVGPFNGLD